MLGVIITGALCAVFIVLSAILLSGHGAMLIAGYNTAKEKEKAKYDEKSSAAQQEHLHISAPLCLRDYAVQNILLRQENYLKCTCFGLQ